MKSIFLVFGLVIGATFATGPAQASSSEGHDLVMSLCSGCHEEVAPNHLFRINDVRKTPEGWDMTLFRMQHVHGVEVAPDERAKILAYLADVQGLAPSETKGYRYDLEQRPDFVDKVPDPELKVMCGRCHTNARYALQRRDAAEWLRHVNFHVGQWPSLEYHASARDRYWWKIATTELPKKLGKMFPLKTAAWAKWSTETHPTLEGVWRVVGHQPGKGLYEGRAIYSLKDDHNYETRYAITGPDGTAIAGTGKAIVYTGYEWRGAEDLGGTDIREVYAASKDGRTLTGRWYEATNHQSGADITAVKIIKGQSRLLVAKPAYVKAGTSARITLIGYGLGGKVDFGSGISARVVSNDGDHVVVDITVAANAVPGTRDIKAGTTTGQGLLTVYNRVDSVRVSPAYAIARVGGGHTPPVPAQFEAVGYMNGPDGDAGTDDDIRIGVMPASWQAKPYNEDAGRMKDVKYAGKLSTDGLFMPSGAGPNPARKYSTNNAGNLAIVATVKDGADAITGESHLIVTVQRWNTPPVR